MGKLTYSVTTNGSKNKSQENSENMETHEKHNIPKCMEFSITSTKREVHSYKRIH